MTTYHITRTNLDDQRVEECRTLKAAEKALARWAFQCPLDTFAIIEETK